MSTIIYHNPRCSKSREALEIIQEKGIKPEVRLYLKENPSVNEITSISAKLECHITELIRFNESIAKELSLKATDQRSKSEWVQLIVENPVLLQRPIVIHNNRAVIARPPQKLLDLI